MMRLNLAPRPARSPLAELGYMPPTLQIIVLRELMHAALLPLVAAARARRVQAHVLEQALDGARRLALLG